MAGRCPRGRGSWRRPATLIGFIPRAREAFLDRRGGLADPDPLDDPRRVARAEGRLLDRRPSPATPRPTGPSAGAGAGTSRNSRPRAQAASRARPRWFIPSGRFAVSSTSRTALAALPFRPLDDEADVGQPAAERREIGELAGQVLPDPFEAELHLRSAPRLVEEADVVLEEESQVGDAVEEHRDPVDPHSEGEAGVALGVDSRRPRGRSGGPSRRP